MFSLFKKKKKDTELDYFKQFFHASYEHYAKIHFPVLIYPNLPKEPRKKNWQERQEYIIAKLIPEDFKQNFENYYLNFRKNGIEIIEKNKSGDINISKRDALVSHFLNSQQKTFINYKELHLTEYKLGDFNVSQQLFDYTPDLILKLTLETIVSEYPESKLTLQRCILTNEPSNWKLNELLKVLNDIGQLHHLDRIYDDGGKWELLQPEESSFLLIGMNSIDLIDKLKQRKLDIEKINN